MSEARLRGLNQSQSNIFSASPSSSSRQKTREIPQNQSKIFEPLEQKPKPMTYAREQYHRTTINFGDETSQFSEPSKPLYQTNLSPAGKKTLQNQTTKYLLGNDRGTFFKKSVDENFGVPKDFEPKYANDSAFERKQKELYNGFSPSKVESPPRQDYEFYNPRERKLQDRVSVFDTNNYKPPEDLPKENTRPPLYNPNVRKNEILTSNVFEDRVPREYQKVSRPKEDDGERRKNHLYSDLFGLSPANRLEKPEKLQAASHFLSTSSKPNLNYDPRDQPLKNLASSIEIGDSPPRPTRNRPKTTQKSYTPRFQDFPSANQMKKNELSTSSYNYPEKINAEIYDLELVSVPPNFTAPEIKDLCGGVHVVSLGVDIDNFTGNCRGNGRLKVRTNDSRDIERLETVFKSKGIRVQHHQENLGRKSNYSEISNVKWNTPYEYKRDTTPGNARDFKMKNLESSAFGGQHKWVDRKIESVDNELQAQLQWKNTKTASRPLY
jgi:hypothetical protein